MLGKFFILIYNLMHFRYSSKAAHKYVNNFIKELNFEKLKESQKTRIEIEDLNSLGVYVSMIRLMKMKIVKARLKLEKVYTLLKGANEN